KARVHRYASIGIRSRDPKPRRPIRTSKQNALRKAGRHRLQKSLSRGGHEKSGLRAKIRSWDRAGAQGNRKEWKPAARIPSRGNARVSYREKAPMSVPVI